ncbi:MAG: polysaccharide biosynthesis tyrosine autokinase [Solirubrobacteraceae bacterium]
MAQDSVPASQQDLRALLNVLWRRKWLLVLLIAGIPTAVYFASASIRATYTSTAVVQVQGAAIDTSLFSPGGGIPQTGAIAAAARLVKTKAVTEEAARRLQPPPPSLKELMASIEVNSEVETGFVTIEAHSFRAQRAAQIANAYAAALVVKRSNQARGQIDATIARVKRQLPALRRSNKTGRRVLREELQRLRSLRAAQNNNAALVEPALVPDSATSPKPLRNAALALILAVLVGVGLAFLIEQLDQRVRRPEELRELAGLPVLGVLPRGSFRSKAGSPLCDSDEMQSLRTSLNYFNIDHPLRSVVVSSARAGEGKTTVAANLAISLARSGRDIILIDADLRRSELSERMGLSPNAPSLGKLLGSLSSLLAALTAVDTDGGRLRVLPAGTPPANPSELMESDRMLEILETAESNCDIVVVDSTPLLPVSDIIPVLREVSGVILLVRMRRTKRTAVKRALEIAELAGGTVLGFVATGVAENQDDYGYGYGGGYGSRNKRRLIPRFRKPAPIAVSSDSSKGSPPRRVASAPVSSARARSKARSAKDQARDAGSKTAASRRSGSGRAGDAK